MTNIKLCHRIRTSLNATISNSDNCVLRKSDCSLYQWQCLLKISNNTLSLLLEKEMIERRVELFLHSIKYPADPFVKQGQKTRACHQRSWIFYDLKFAQRSFENPTHWTLRDKKLCCRVIISFGYPDWRETSCRGLLSVLSTQCSDECVLQRCAGQILYFQNHL